MHRFFAYLFLSVLVACQGHEPRTARQTTPTPPTAAAQTAAPAADEPAVLRAFLDSVGHLPPAPLAARAAFWADSVFRHQRRLSRHLSDQDLGLLKQAARNGKIRVQLARRIFSDTAISETCNRKNAFLEYPVGYIPITYQPFSTRAGEECGFIVGDPFHCPNAYLYFLQGSQVIARHEVDSRYGLGLQHYRDTDGRIVVYYVREFTSGSGIWWNNYFFYKYRGQELTPILNEVENGNAQPFWGYRTLWLETTVEKTRPLTVKMVYYAQLNDTIQPVTIAEDSTWVQYAWNEREQRLEGQFQQSKISGNQVLTYTLADNELLFINSYYHQFKTALLDSSKRRVTLNYLRKVRAASRRRQ